jgi:PilZ domain
MKEMMPQSPYSGITSRNKKEINRRRSIRYSPNAAMRYRVLRDGEFVFSGNGQILDMSAHGLRISLGRTVSVGTSIEIVADWTGLYHGRDKMRLLLVAEVLRSDESSTALRILRHEFRDLSVRLRPVPNEPRRAVA